MAGVEGIEPGTESLFPLAKPWHILDSKLQVGIS